MLLDDRAVDLFVSPAGTSIPCRFSIPRQWYGALLIAAGIVAVLRCGGCAAHILLLQHRKGAASTAVAAQATGPLVTGLFLRPIPAVASKFEGSGLHGILFVTAQTPQHATCDR